MRTLVAAHTLVRASRRPLDGHMARQMPVNLIEQNDPLLRGLALGLLFGALLWAGLIVLAWQLWHWVM
jgi:hypothetical protein